MISSIVRQAPGVVLLSIMGFGSSVLGAGSPIDTISLNTLDGDPNTYSPGGNGLEVIGEADVYHLHNGLAGIPELGPTRPISLINLPSR